jgi:hypothetical protein
MTRELRSLKSPGAFLQSEFSTPEDLLLISQVELWSISRGVFDVFGADTESSIVSQRSVELERLNGAYDKWYKGWLDVLTLKDKLDTFIHLMFDLYFYSAKLYLFSHAFRGSSQEIVEKAVDSRYTENFAHCALESALSIICCIKDQDEPSPWLEKLPSYFGTMIAFASVCLMRTSYGENTVSTIETSKILGYLRQLVGVLQRSSIADHTTHPLLSIAKSLEPAISRRESQLLNNKYEGSNNDQGLANSDMALDLRGFVEGSYLDFSLTGDMDDWMTFPDGEAFLFPDPGHL